MAQTIVTLSGDDAELYKAFQRILDQQAKTDAGYKKIRSASKEAADAAKAAAKDQADAEKQRERFIGGAVSQVTSLVGAYLSVQTAVQALSNAHETLITNQDKALAKALELASAQQEAAKNLAGQTPEAISQTLQKTVPEIARSTQFQDLPKLTTALGSAASIVGEEKATGVVSAAAQLTRFTPDQLQTTTTSTADIMAATGLKDAKEALALLASTGSVARPEELAKLSQGAAAAVNAAIAQAPKQDRVDAAKEGIALYAKLTKVDPTGQSAATASVDFLRQISSVFTDPKVIKERTERIETLRLSQNDNQLAMESAKLKIQDTERTATFFSPTDQTPEAKTARLNVEKAQQDLAQAELKVRRDADELKRLEVVQRVTLGVTPEQADAANQAERERRAAEMAADAQRKDQLRTQIEARFPDIPFGVSNLSAERTKGTALERDPLVAEFQKLAAKTYVSAIQQPATAPTTFLDRLKTVRQTPELRAVVSENITGEAKFRPLFSQLLEGTSEISKELADATKVITTDVKAFADVAKSTVETPQARVVAETNRVDTLLAIQRGTDTEGQVRAAVSKIYTEAMRATSIDVWSGLETFAGTSIQSVFRPLDGKGSFGIQEIKNLQERIEYLTNQGASGTQIETAKTAMDSINRLLILPERLDQMRAEGLDTKQYMERQLQVLEATNRVLERMEAKLGPSNNQANNLRLMLMEPGAAR